MDVIKDASLRRRGWGQSHITRVIKQRAQESEHYGGIAPNTNAPEVLSTREPQNNWAVDMLSPDVRERYLAYLNGELQLCSTKEAVQ